MDGMGSERFGTVVIGAGQAGLSAGYYLKRAGRSFVILDANGQVGGSWLNRYDSLQLFTPSWAVRLPGWRFRSKDVRYPSRDQMVAFLQSYAERFDMPVRTGVRVEEISRDGDRFVISTDAGRIEADDVIVATGAHRDPRIPAFSRELDPSIVQLHSGEYRNPSQLRDGEVLVVGAGNSGADISLDVVGEHPTWLSGPDRGHVPVSIDKDAVAQRIARTLQQPGSLCLDASDAMPTRMRLAFQRAALAYLSDVGKGPHELLKSLEKVRRSIDHGRPWLAGVCG